MTYFTISFVLILGLVSTSTVCNADSCCSKTVYIKNSSKCSDGKVILPKCSGYTLILNNAWDFYTSYIIRNDTEGEYLDDFVGAFIVRSPNTHREYYRDLKTKIDESDNPIDDLPYWTLLDIVSNLLSFVFLAVAFYIYYLVIPTRQIEDECLLNYIGSLCISHATLSYDLIISSGETPLPYFCITNLYVLYYFILSGFAWYVLFMYYNWKKFKSGLLVEDTAIMKKFRIIAYGVSAFIIIFINIHAHVGKLYTEYRFESECLVHQILIEDLYIYAPITLAVGLNGFFWQDLKKHVEITAVKTTEEEIDKRKINSLLTLNRRMFFSFGLPWLIFIVINGVTEFHFNGIIHFLWLSTDSVTNGIGVVIALILVMSRARVWKHVINKYSNFQVLQKWQPSDEEQITTFTDKSSLNDFKTFPSEV